MLLLTRSRGQRLYIGDDIVITMCKAEGGTVRLGIDAPRDIKIVRSEIAHKYDANGKRLGK